MRVAPQRSARRVMDEGKHQCFLLSALGARSPRCFQQGRKPLCAPRASARYGSKKHKWYFSRVDSRSTDWMGLTGGSATLIVGSRLKLTIIG